MRLLQWIVLFATVLFTSQAVAIKDFSFKDINGKSHQLSDYKGKWAIVNYWGVRCAPCRAEVPELNNIVRKYRDKATVIGIELMSSSNKDIRAFMGSNGMRFTVAGTQSSVINPLGTIRKLPTTFIISPEGKLVKTHAGILTEKDVKGYLSSKQKPAPIVKKEAAPKKEVVAEKAPEKKVVNTVAAKPQAKASPAPAKQAPKAPEKKVVVQAKPQPQAKAAPAPKATKKDNSHDILMGLNADDFF
jgi:thiol-disulfide isomerase/thioredoxin